MTSVSHSLGEGDGAASIGGTNPHMFAEDGETSYPGQHPSWNFALFVHLARLSQTSWRIHQPFHSSSITLMDIAM